MSVTPIIEANCRCIPGRRCGRRATYVKAKCRCNPCTEVNTMFQSVVRQRRANHPIPAHIPHGRLSTYQNWGCKCVLCKAENTKASAERRASDRKRHPKSIARRRGATVSTRRRASKSAAA